jgi:hypothetical protein
MEIVLRRMPLSEELLYYSRRCASRAFGGTDASLRLVVELVSGRRYRATLETGADDGPHFDLSPDPYIAIGNVFAKASVGARASAIAS